MVRQVVKQGGITSLWSGLVPTLWRDAPFSAIYWSFFELFKRSIKGSLGDSSSPPPSKSVLFIVDFTSGATAGMLSAVITTPIDVIKTRRQMFLTPNQVSLQISLSFLLFFVCACVRELTAGFGPETSDAIG
jgi:solute carrier family 25 protein 39/40